MIIIGGGMANAFIKAQGCNIGSSLFEEGHSYRYRPCYGLV